MTQKKILINEESFIVNVDEYTKIDHLEFNCLTILEKLGYHERIISLLNDLSQLFLNKNILFYNISHGGHIPIKCSDYFNKVFIENTTNSHLENLKKNIGYYNIKNIFLENSDLIKDITVILDYSPGIQLIKNTKIIICNLNLIQQVDKDLFTVYYLSNSEVIICVSNIIHYEFIKEFHYYIENENFKYDNLINLAMIIKNGGNSLEHVLNENMDIIDRWTILDTGSTDDTIDIINKVLVGKKKGNLYQEPFINFRESRNRCLDLAGKKCKYTIMLDDTYIIKGNLRHFLNEVRGDQFSSSFSLYIQSDDVQYTSNRITKSDLTLRYIYRIHEVISPKNNTNVIVPINHSYIFDYRSDYMENRTMSRKQYDLEILYDTVKEYPDDSRAYYYLGQTYNLIGEQELAYENFLERMNHKDEGFSQEKLDAIFEAARIANFKLNKPWEDCEKLYFKAYEIDKTRPDSLYFIGIHYYLEAQKGINVYENQKKAYNLFKVGFELGYPLNSQYSLKPTLSFYFLPKFLTELCYTFNDFITGEKASDLYLDTVKTKIHEKIYKDIYNSQEHDIVTSWNRIYKVLNYIPYENLKIKVDKKEGVKPYLCFLVDGGFTKWSGRDILSKGIGGAETFVIEMARYIQKSGYYQVIVFCNCEEVDNFEGVQYVPLLRFFDFMQKNYIDTCIISRYTEYLPLCLQSDNIENVYVSMHDLVASFMLVMPRTNKLKKIFCLSDWHVRHFTGIFDSLKDITVPFNYGIDTTLFKFKDHIQKIPYKFIYSSFASRGLLCLLQMWPKIVQRYPEATLHLHCDIYNSWANGVKPEEMKLIQNIIMDENREKSIIYHGWTSKKDLANNWLSSDIWFYPCTFIETFCLTALEAALTKTFVITRNFGSLAETVANRGVFLDSNNLEDPYTIEWQEKALIDLFSILGNKDLKDNLIEDNYNWARNMSWETRANLFIKEQLYDTITYIPPSVSHKNIDNRFNYADMYNWTNDLPNNDRFNNSYNDYLNILEYIKWKHTDKEINVLEIGTYAGTSIIKILELLPNSKGTVIDSWKNYEENTYGNGVACLKNIENNNIEDIFHDNIKIAGINNMNVFKGDSCNILMDMIANNMKFDIIYVDGSHTLMDSYTDLVLSFNLLNKGGVIGIDDYPYNYTENTKFESPFIGVEYFLEKFKSKFQVLHKEYRVFIEKL